jgi:serine/threonine protein kinase/TolB-like protein/tetratricopeptide (TPR) repeat protein
MTPERWQEIKRVFDDALALAAPERAAFLGFVAQSDHELSAEVASLVASYDANSRLMETPAIAASGLEARTQGATWSGRVLGMYRVAELVGEGGMGAVYRAVRADGMYQRPVAIKVIRSALSTEFFLRRFDNERRILARLDHPNIARLIDAGVSEENVPYVVMEFVDGIPIEEYCRREQLSVRGRLQLFRSVCEAVQYAHQNLIVHRDLKPANILVTAEGEPKLLDFGIAKLRDLQQNADEGQPITQRPITQLPIMTPEFASPEQIRGEAVTTASDVYSLGVVLYLLLTGQRPYRAASHSLPDVIRAVCDTDAAKPSAAVEESEGVDPRTLRRLRWVLRGELDNIVLMALRKEPQRRYQSVKAFSEDIRRHLENLPISAIRDTLRYRFRKLLARHRTGVAAGFMVVVALLAGALAYFAVDRFGNSIVQAPGAVAFAPPPHSIAVLPFVNMSGDATQEYFSDGITEELLNSLSRLNGMQVVARTSSFSFKGQHVDVSTIAHKLNVGAILEGSVRRAGRTVRITAQLIDGVTGFHLWSQTYDRDLTDFLDVQTEVASSVARELEVKLVGNEAAQIELGGTRSPDAYEAYLRGTELLSTGDVREADLRAALAALDQAVALDPNYARAQVRRAAALSNLAIFGDLKPDERERVRGLALQAAERAIALAPGLGEAHLALGRARAYVLLDFRGAAPEFDRALALSPGDARVQLGFAGFVGQIGHFEAALKGAHRAVTLDPQNVNAHMTLGLVLAAARRYDEALGAYRAAKALRPGSTYISNAIAFSLLAAGRFEQARELCDSLSSPEARDGRARCLALAYHGLGRQHDAERALEEYKAARGDLPSAFGLAQTYAQWGNKAAALEELEKAWQQRAPQFQALRVNWELDPIRNEPKFKAIEARMNFPP